MESRLYLVVSDEGALFVKAFFNKKAAEEYVDWHNCWVEDYKERQALYETKKDCLLNEAMQDAYDNNTNIDLDVLYKENQILRDDFDLDSLYNFQHFVKIVEVEVVHSYEI